MTHSTVEDDALGITHTNAILSFKPIALEANGAANILDLQFLPQDFQQDFVTPSHPHSPFNYYILVHIYVLPILIQQTLLIISIESIPKSRFNPNSDTRKAVPQYHDMPNSPDI